MPGVVRVGGGKTTCFVRTMIEIAVEFSGRHGNILLRHPQYSAQSTEEDEEEEEDAAQSAAYRAPDSLCSSS